MSELQRAKAQVLSAISSPVITKRGVRGSAVSNNSVLPHAAFRLSTPFIVEVRVAVAVVAGFLVVVVVVDVVVFVEVPRGGIASWAEDFGRRKVGFFALRSFGRARCAAGGWRGRAGGCLCFGVRRGAKSGIPDARRDRDSGKSDAGRAGVPRSEMVVVIVLAIRARRGSTNTRDGLEEEE